MDICTLTDVADPDETLDYSAPEQQLTEQDNPNILPLFADFTDQPDDNVFDMGQEDPLGKKRHLS